MEQSIFNLFDAINREGIDNSTWGFAKTLPTHKTISAQKNLSHFKGNLCMCM